MLSLPDLRLPATPPGTAGVASAPETAAADGADDAADFAALVQSLGGTGADPGALDVTPTGAEAALIAGMPFTVPAGAPGSVGAAGADLLLAAGGKALPAGGKALPTIGKAFPALAQATLADEAGLELEPFLPEAELPVRQLERALGLAIARGPDALGAGQAIAAQGLTQAGPGQSGSTVPAGGSLNSGQLLGSMPLPGPGVPGFEDALGQRLIWMAARGVQDARVRIVPEHLGPIDIRVRIEGDSTQVLLTSPNPASREALELALPRLREQLGDAGLQLVQADVGGQDPRADAGGGEPGAGAPGNADASAEDDADALSHTSGPQAGQRVGLLDLFA